ncbi:hypothetical protein FGO68_gene7799 [Halteria grandinella]|uniref:Uncharacterized protein n=1 Tax=Halteria grandinella TaxID=5974 RepID=A0A8J8SZS2_HALGN|nr:hypothetical protein FGO68_gene7799 [Halteria grandinella]
MSGFEGTSRIHIVHCLQMDTNTVSTMHNDQQEQYQLLSISIILLLLVRRTTIDQTQADIPAQSISDGSFKIIFTRRRCAMRFLSGSQQSVRIQASQQTHLYRITSIQWLGPNEHRRIFTEHTEHLRSETKNAQILKDHH